MSELTKAPPPERPVETEFIDPNAPIVGRWFWIAGKDERWLGCVTHVGSNYAELESAEGGTARIHFDEFNELCELEPNAEKIINRTVMLLAQDVGGLMQEVQETTARLAITMGPKALAPGSEVSALSLRSGGQPVEEYKSALVKAKQDTLPELFKRIEEKNTQMGRWMSASLIPLKAQAEAMRPAIKLIESRIFNVELYAGLVESVEQIAEGKPAELNEKIHLFQRRAYMDEECLANYKTGGMRFNSIGKFDRWLVKKDNLNRLLPFPRCILAFQVRRNGASFEGGSIRDFIQFVLESDADKQTFLYIRNGEQVFRLQTEIDFGGQLFPDEERSRLNGKIYAQMFAGRVNKLIPEGEIEEARDQGFYDIVPYSPESVYYDDIQAKLKDEIDQHNRLVLVLQGLLDRSPVLHPHPTWLLSTPEGFERALKLIYDDSRAIAPGAAPDFEAYRARLNASLKTGCVTVGQEEAWKRFEAEKENRRRDASWRNRSEYRYERYSPYGNPGPGALAKVVRFSPTNGCTFKWTRDRQGVLTRRDRWAGKKYDDPIPCSITVPASKLLNVSAYTPGDFKQFFADPRTRADYLKWAPLLLEAEEFHAGNRKETR